MRQRLQALTRAYIDSLAGKADLLQKNLKECQAAAWSEQSLAQLHLMTHRLVGSLGVHNFDQLQGWARSSSELTRPGMDERFRWQVEQTIEQLITGLRCPVSSDQSSV